MFWLPDSLRATMRILLFSNILKQLDIKQPKNGISNDINETIKIASNITTLFQSNFILYILLFISVYLCINKKR